jgi:hypothetical protein
MIDVKKFVVAFLVLAAVAGASSLILLHLGGPSGNNSAAANNAPAGNIAASSQNQQSGPFALGNAFVPSQGQDNNASDNFLTEDSSSSASSSDPNNLTSQLADSILGNLFALNPDGPQTTSNGQSIIAEPNATSVVAGLSSSTLADVQIPDWSYQAETVPLNITTNTSSAAVASYYNALNSIWENDFVSTNLQTTVAGSNPTPGDLSLAGAGIQDALAKISALSVPSTLADFQKSLVKVLVYEKNSVALAGDSSSDPMRTALVLQDEQSNYNTAVQSLEDAMQSAPQADAVTPRDGALGLLDNYFGVPTAHAQFGGIVFDPSVFARMVWQFVQGILLQVLKNELITQLQGRALSFIQNKGNPRYVTGWGGLLANSFNTAAGSALGQIEPGLCPNFSATVSGWLGNIYPGAVPVAGGITLNGGGATNCTLQNSIGSTANFYNDFNTGGFAGFGALLSPQNNPFGAFATAYDETQSLGASAAGASQNQAIAGQGYTGISVCDNGQDASAPQLVCTVGVLQGNQCVQPNGNQVVGTPVMRPAGCPDGTEPITTFPGVNAADTLNRNLGSDIDLIVNANDITGLLATVTDALMQQVITSGVNALNGALTPGTAAPAIPPAGGVAQPTPAPLPIACNPSSATAAVGTPFTFGATGGDGLNYNWTAFGGTPATGNGIAFTTTFNASGTYAVTASGVVNGVTQFSSCQVKAQ